MKNWIFTLITCILLALLAVIMLLGAFEVDGFTLARDLLHLLVAVILSLYIIFALIPMVVQYRGKVKMFVVAEIAILILTVIGQACVQFVNIPILSGLQACSVLGLAIWLRGVVETVHAYLLRGTESKKKIPLWGLCCYIGLSAFGMWQIARPTIADKHFLFAIGAISLIMAAIFGYATAQNRKGKGEGKKVKKKKKEEKEEKEPEQKQEA
ncbi:MAG: hypothetical protein E7663_03440 [Ruminococcaceae bacterium]|nr:hypothetical protein [Oscillospiraceae bacterium]